MNWAHDTFFEFVNQFWIEMHQKALADASKLASLIKTVFSLCIAASSSLHGGQKWMEIPFKTALMLMANFSS